MQKTNLKNSGNYLPLAIVIVVVVLDQVSKTLIQNNFILNQTQPIIKNFFNFTYLTNTGAGFGILQEFNLPLLFLSLAVAGFIMFYFDKIKTRFERICFSLVLAGIIGNVIDRITLGYVVDFIDFRWWPAFNIADSAICVGIIGLMIYYWKTE